MQARFNTARFPLPPWVWADIKEVRMISGITGVRETVDVIDNVADMAHLGNIKPYPPPSVTSYA